MRHAARVLCNAAQRALRQQASGSVVCTCVGRGSAGGWGGRSALGLATLTGTAGADVATGVDAAGARVAAGVAASVGAGIAAGVATGAAGLPAAGIGVGAGVSMLTPRGVMTTAAPARSTPFSILLLLQCARNCASLYVIHMARQMRHL